MKGKLVFDKIIIKNQNLLKNIRKKTNKNLRENLRWEKEIFCTCKLIFLHVKIMSMNTFHSKI